MNTSLTTQITDALKRTPGNIVGGGVDLANIVLGLITGRGLQGLSDTPVGGSKQLNSMLGLEAEPTQLPQQVIEDIAGLASPGALVKGGGSGHWHIINYDVWR